MPIPNLLLLEDDPPTCLFLCEALMALPAQVQCAATLAQAEQAITHSAFDLWLFDAHVPDGHSAELLARRGSVDTHCPAIALTADNDPSSAAALRAAGFAQVLIKPVSAAALLHAVRKLLAWLPSAAGEHAVWNHNHALAAAGGVESTRAALNALFLRELPELQQQIINALEHGEDALAASLLHRLKGSCALVGADALLGAVSALAGEPGRSALRDQFVDACAQTLR